jgi:ribosomal protein S18 acetylase RimI-like enzyme
MPEPDIRLLSANEPRDVFLQLACLHVDEISDGFLTSLGVPVITELYRAVSRCPNAFIVTANLDGRLLGFLCASTNTRLVYHHVLLRTWRPLLPLIVRHLFRRRTLVRCWETLTYPTRTTAPDVSVAEILNFCVADDVQRTGLGRKLFGTMETEYFRRGIRSIRIVTGAKQKKAIRFYEKIGAKLFGRTEVHAHSESLIFSYTIAEGNKVSLPTK